jgi:hypothetical protein
MKKNILTFIAAFWCFVSYTNAFAYHDQIDLQGKWQFALDADAKLSVSSTFNDFVTLPGTTDTNRKGTPCTKKDETTHLSRLFSYAGKAWYRRTVDIPKTWEKKIIRLHLERTKPTTVFIDGKLVGTNNDISTAQTYDLSQFIKPGKHEITIMVDNGSGVPKQLYANSHAYTEDTQTNWNGIIGQMYLDACDPIHISDMKTYPDIDHATLQIKVSLSGKLKKDKGLTLYVIDNSDAHSSKAYPCDKYLKYSFNGTDYEVTIPIDTARIKPWSEFHPNLYTLEADVAGIDHATTTFGFRSFTARNHHFYINDHETFLRGKHDACVFPLTAHVPMDVASWRHHLQVCKDYGINHVRFHSWCPPEAAFQAADEMGIYLQPELPFWGDFNAKDTVLMTFLKKEGENILRTYGHHPSFVMMALGNELWGSIDEMKRFTDDFRTIDSTKLYTFGSNYYLGYQGWKPGMDYFTTCRVGGEKYGEYNTHVRGSFSFADAADGGLINHEYPNTVTTFDDAIKPCPVPVISHETAQFQTYPDYQEIKKYTGVLYPYNMEVFRSRLEKAGMGDQAQDFHNASGRWAAQLYKADIEMDLRTRNMAGFQLLDLQDYPGQGSAYIGILDAFMESKGITTPAEFRQSCAPVVPLLITPKYCYSSDETANFCIKIANYSEQPLHHAKLSWTINKDNGDIYGNGSLDIPYDSIGLFGVGNIVQKINVDKAGRYSLILAIGGTAYRNTYPLWFYPATKDLKPIEKDIIITTKMTDEIGKKLEKGAHVLFMPDSTQFTNNTVGGLFQTDYWNYRMFKTISENNKKPVSPGTLGILTNPKHPLFNDFPTDSCTSWQWFPVIKASHPLILDNLPQPYRPIVQVIDNIELNHKLGLIFEFSIGKGSLLVCMSDLQAASKYPEGRQLYKSILEYMSSKAFAPQSRFTLHELMDALTKSTETGNIKELKNISFD